MSRFCPPAPAVDNMVHPTISISSTESTLHKRLCSAIQSGKLVDVMDILRVNSLKWRLGPALFVSLSTNNDLAVNGGYSVLASIL